MWAPALPGGVRRPGQGQASGPGERAGRGEEGVVRGPGEVAAPVAVGPVGGLMEGEGDIDDVDRERQDPRVVGQQME